MVIRHTVFLLLVGCVIFAGFAFITAWDYGLIHPIEVPSRPATVPQDAVAIPNIAKTSMYARCWLANSQPFCEVLAPDGTVVWRERVLPSQPGAAISPEHLQIDTIRTRGRDFITLTNGTYLLPSTNYEGHQRVLENRHCCSVISGSDTATHEFDLIAELYAETLAVRELSAQGTTKDWAL